jgi:hypothetical protein
VEVIIGASADAFHPEGRPLLQNFPHAHDPGLARDKDVEVAAEPAAESEKSPTDK